MRSLFEKPKPVGHFKATVIRANGERFVHCDEENTIHSDLKDYLAAALQTNSTQSLDLLFNLPAGVTPLDPVVAPTAGRDGIIYFVTDAIAYGFKCTGTGVGTEALGWSGSSASRKLTGEFRGVAITLSTAAYIYMGFNYKNATFGFTNIWANPSSWASLTLATADRLIIEWTITLT